MMSPPQLSLVETRIQYADCAGSNERITVDAAALPGITTHPASCDAHHLQLHLGVIAIRGTAPDNLVFELPLAHRGD